MQANQAHYRRVPQLGSTGHTEELRLAGTDAGAGATTPPTSSWWRSCCPALCARRVVLDLCGNAAAADWGDRDSPFGELPDEVLERIWSRLDHRSLALGAALVCRRWAELVARETVWCQLCLWHARGAHPAPSWLLSLAEAHTDPRDPVELPEHLADRSWKEFCGRFDAKIPQNPSVSLKLMVVGASGCGKSMFMRRFAENTYDREQLHVPTIGVDYRIKTVGIKGRGIRLQLWDTAGEERFRAISYPFYRGMDGAFLCFDLTNHASFEILSTFLTPIREHRRRATPVLLVGLKAEQAERQVSVLEVEEFATALTGQLGMWPQYVECSSRTAYGVEHAVYSLVREVLRSALCLEREASSQLHVQKQAGCARLRTCCCLCQD